MTKEQFDAAFTEVYCAIDDVDGGGLTYQEVFRQGILKGLAMAKDHCTSHYKADSQGCLWACEEGDIDVLIELIQELK